MATLVSSDATLAPTPTDNQNLLTARRALHTAWITWLTLMAIPFLYFVYVAWRIGGYEGPINRPLTDPWFLAAVAYLVLASPAAFFLRSRYFKAYWSGDCVQPRAYVTGMAILWVTMVVGGLISLTGALFSHALVPHLFPALVAFVMFAIHWPNGRAMVSCGRGASDDPERYEEPR